MEKHPLDLSYELNQQGDHEGSVALLKPLAEQGDPRAIFNLGWHEMREGNFHEGMLKLIAGRQLNCFGLPPLQTDKPIWHPSMPLEGKKLLFRCEGGYGDQIAMLRFAKNYADKGALITVACARSLFPLFRTVPFVHALIDNEYAVGADHDYWMPAMSSTVPLELEFADIYGGTYLQVQTPMPLVDLDSKNLNVGVRWAGSYEFSERHLREFPAEKMFSLFDTKGVDFYSLQKTDTVKLADGKSAKIPLPPLPKNVRNMDDAMTDWLATAEIVAALDLVITSCTSIAHLAGALGIPTWIIVPKMPYYMWCPPGDKTVWYDSVTLFRQEKVGCWEAPFARVQQKLGEIAR